MSKADIEHIASELKGKMQLIEGKKYVPPPESPGGQQRIMSQVMQVDNAAYRVFNFDVAQSQYSYAAPGTDRAYVWVMALAAKDNIDDELKLTLLKKFVAMIIPGDEAIPTLIDHLLQRLKEQVRETSTRIISCSAVGHAIALHQHISAEPPAATLSSPELSPDYPHYGGGNAVTVRWSGVSRLY